MISKFTVPRALQARLETMAAIIKRAEVKTGPTQRNLARAFCPAALKRENNFKYLFLLYFY